MANSTGLPPPTMQGRTGSPAQAAYNNRHQQNTSDAALANLFFFVFIININIL